VARPLQEASKKEKEKAKKARAAGKKDLVRGTGVVPDGCW
jgi:hypothetical protein